MLQHKLSAEFTRVFQAAEVGISFVICLTCEGERDPYVSPVLNVMSILPLSLYADVKSYNSLLACQRMSQGPLSWCMVTVSPELRMYLLMRCVHLSLVLPINFVTIFSDFCFSGFLLLFAIFKLTPEFFSKPSATILLLRRARKAHLKKVYIVTVISLCVYWISSLYI